MQRLEVVRGRTAFLSDFSLPQANPTRPACDNAVGTKMSASHYNAAPLQPAAAGAMMLQAEQEQEPRWLLRYELAFLAFFGFFNVCE